MRDPKNRLWWQLVVLAATLLVIDRTYHWYARRHINPFVTLDAALRAAGADARPGSLCFAFSGGSDMASAVDTKEIAAGFASAGAARPCLADLTIGGTSTDVRFMALREYVRRGGKMDRLVLGFRGAAIGDAEELEPGYYLGNNAMVFDWGSLADLPSYYPRLSFVAVDNAARFALFRVTSLGAHRQALWLNVMAGEERVGLRPRVETNRFGVVDEFKKLAEHGEGSRNRGTSWELGLWYRKMMELAASNEARVYFVRLPALAGAEKAWFASDESRRALTDFVAATARSTGGRLIDLSSEPWVDDSLLVDGLHFSARGAALISRALGEALADAEAHAAVPGEGAK